MIHIFFSPFPHINLQPDEEYPPIGTYIPDIGKAAEGQVFENISIDRGVRIYCHSKYYVRTASLALWHFLNEPCDKAYKLTNFCEDMLFYYSYLC